MTAARPAHTLYFDRAHIEEGLVPGADGPIVASPVTEWHTDATVAVNPADPEKVIAAWCGYIDPTDPAREEVPNFRVWVAYSTDGGVSWVASALPPIVGGAGHPVLAYGPDEVAYLLTCEGGGDGGRPRIFRSADDGATWTAAKAPPEPLSMPWLACDPARAGRLYLTTGFFRWSDPPSLAVAVVWRSDDSGETWSPRKVLRDEAGSPLLAWAPHVSVAADGTVHVVSMSRDSAWLWHWRSIDAGESFSVQRAALPILAWSPVLPDDSLWVNGCAAAGRFVVAWTDVRDGVSRIYYRATDEDGRTWVGPDTGTPLLPSLPKTAVGHHVRPRLAATPQGAVGCAFYELALDAGGPRLAMMLAAALRWEDGFGAAVAVSDAPWKPASEPGSGDTYESRPFVGDYFGLAADASSFLVVWPQAPLGPKPDRPPHSEDLWVHRTSEGWVVIRIRGGKVVGVVRFPEPGPEPADASDVVRALRARALPRALDGGEAVHGPGATRALGRVLREVADLLDGGLPAQRGATEDRHR